MDPLVSAAQPPSGVPGRDGATCWGTMSSSSLQRWKEHRLWFTLAAAARLLCFKLQLLSGRVDAKPPNDEYERARWRRRLRLSLGAVGAGLELKHKHYIYPSLVDCIPGLRDNLK